jgi:hypothetical protein
MIRARFAALIAFSCSLLVLIAMVGPAMLDNFADLHLELIRGAAASIACFILIFFASRWLLARFGIR